MNRTELEEQLNALYTENANLEARLSSGDYKVIKNSEAERAGEELPYNPQELHSERQAMRETINANEAEIERIKRELEEMNEESDEIIND